MSLLHVKWPANALFNSKCITSKLVSETLNIFAICNQENSGKKTLPFEQSSYLVFGLQLFVLTKWVLLYIKDILIH
jgi:hypothetical protein